ncbi:MAG TPA: YCF48-related protein, partial [Pyrinomonadaceae bacterium]|nr:YCF48-related protein [Pyrinomonadaceae bacterium]
MLLGTFYLLSAQEGPGWIWQNPKPQGNNLSSVAFAKNGLFGISVGQSNEILITQDGGFNWEIVRLISSAPLSSVAVLDENQAIVIGARGFVAYTENGGKTWRQAVTNTRYQLNTVIFDSDGKTGWITGSSGTLLTTQNSGRQWQQVLLDINDNLTAAAVLQNKHLAIASDQGNVFILDSNSKVIKKASPCGTKKILSLSASAGNALAISATGGCIMKSADGGFTWTNSIIFSRTEFNTIAYTGSSGFRAADLDGNIWLSGDLGSSWLPVYVPQQPRFNSLFFINEFTGWAVGDFGRIYRTDDGGLSWQKLFDGYIYDINDIVLLDDRIGVAVCSSGRILLTNDAGETWLVNRAGTESSLNSVAYFGESWLWAVGANGTVLRSNNGGASWGRGFSGSEAELRSVFFVNARTGYAVGEAGTILRSDSAGAYWRQIPSPTRMWLEEIKFITKTRGVAVGDRGTILLTEDGEHFRIIETKIRENLYSVSFADEKNGYVVG